MKMKHIPKSHPSSRDGSGRIGRHRAARLLAGWFSLMAAFTLPTLELRAQGNFHTVHIYNFDFSLNPVGQPVLDPTILPGDTVRWVWDQGFHSTTAVLGQLEFWDSAVQSGGTFDRVFAVPGVFNYYSRPFGFDNGDGTAGGMSGTITVIPEPAATTFLWLGLLAAAITRRSKRRHGGQCDCEPLNL